MIRKTALIFLLLTAGRLMGQSDYFVAGTITIEGNKKTKRPIILRELLFQTGDTIRVEDWPALKKSSRENLVNTSLFHFATITLNDSRNKTRNITVRVTERWYFWPVPQITIDERNFNVWWKTKSLQRVSGGVFFTQENFRGRMEVLKFLVMAGYNQVLGMAYDAPYINKKKTFGLGSEVIWRLRHEVNNATLDDKQVYFKSDEPVQTDWLAALHFRYRPDYYISHLLQLRYQRYRFSDSLLALSPGYSYQGLKTLQWLGFYYKLKDDHRDYKPYPLRGWYADLEVWKYGMGILNNKGLNIWNFKTTSRKYFELGRRFYAAAGLIAKISNNTPQPYLIEEGLGYGRDFVRGYEYYVIDGRHYGVVKANIKWALLPQRKIKMKFIKTEKFNTIPVAFYLNLFGDAGYVWKKEIIPGNTLPNTLLYSAGLGLDFVTYYDGVARIEYAVNALGESGFFLHFIAPI